MPRKRERVDSLSQAQLLFSFSISLVSSVICESAYVKTQGFEIHWIPLLTLPPSFQKKKNHCFYYPL